MTQRLRWLLAFVPLVFGCVLPACGQARSFQDPSGKITFVPADASLNGAASRQVDHIIFSEAGDGASWDYKPTRWGMYDLEISVSDIAPNARNLEVEVGRKIFKYENSAQLGRVYIAKAEPFTVTVRSRDAGVKLAKVVLTPAPEGKPITQASPVINLHARDAVTHSVMMRYEPATNKNCLGYWANPGDTAEWQFTVTQPGDYQIELWQGCGKGQGGSDVLVELRDANSILTESRFVVEDTGHFQNFIPRNLGRVSFTKAGEYTLWVKPQRKQAGAVMDIRQVALIPKKPLLDQFLANKRVVFLGDSITYAGEYIEFLETYLRLNHPNASFEIIDLGLPSETLSGLSEPGHAGGSFPRPDLHERLARVLEKAKPDLVFACYGMNDGIYYPFSEDRFAKYREGTLRLRERVAAAGGMLVHVTPPTFDSVPLKGHTLPAGRDEYRSPYEGYNEVLDRFSDWLVQQRNSGWEVIDIHAPMNRFLQEQRAKDPKFLLAGDGVHANTQGHWVIAREFLRSLGAPAEIVSADTPEALLKSKPNAPQVLKLVQERQRLLKDAWLNTVGHLRPGMSKGRPLPEAEARAAEIGAKIDALTKSNAAFPGKRSEWNGFARFDFEVDGKPVLVVTPKTEAPGRPWVWHGEFFGHKPNPDIALLGRGFHVVYMSVPDMLGGPEAVAHWNAFHEILTTRYGFAKKAALVGLSRGGLYCYNWAAANPDKVACLYGDAPVCDFKSWPGAFGKGKRSDRDWQLILQRYGFQSDAEAKAYTRNPVDNLAPLAAAKVPLLHVFGDADEVVPWDENTGIIAERYPKLGGEIKLIRKPGVKHHPHGLDDSTPIIEFIWDHTASPEAKTWFAAQRAAAAENQKVLRAGASIVDISPTNYPVLVNAMFTERTATQTVDRLEARAIVLDDSSTRIAIVVVDSCMVARDLIDRAKSDAEKKTGIPTERMLVSSTHTHSAPSAMGCLGSRMDTNYAAFLPGKITEAIVAANASLRPARVGWAVVDDWEHTFNRRWIRRPDRMIDDPFGERTVRAHMHPGHESPDAIGPSGPVDPALSVIALQTTDGRPLALLANYSQHYYGSPLLSSDYYGRFRKEMATLLGATPNDQFVAIMSQGTSGDQMWMDYGAPRKEIGYEAYAREVAARALEAYRKIQFTDWAPLKIAQRTLHLKYRAPGEERLAWARQVAGRLAGRLPQTLPEVYALEAIYLHERPETDLILQALRIGELGIAAIPNEVYALTGLKLKAQSPLQPTVNIELANGAEGYIPTPEQHKLGGYTTWPARTAGLEVQAEPKIVETLLSLFEEVSGKPRRPIAAAHGEYAKSVLAANPLAYWRFEEMNIPVARDSSPNNRSGTYEEGVALYLPGPGSGTGISPHPELIPSSFSGPEKINRAAHFAGGRMKANVSLGRTYTAEMWIWNGLESSARAVTGYFFSRGPDGDTEANGDQLGIGGAHSPAASGKLIFYNGNKGGQLLAGTSVIPRRTWRHVALIREGDRVRVYLDGRLEISGEAKATSDSPQIFLGGRNDGFANFEGKLDEVALYAGALSAEQIAAHAQSGR